MQSVFKKIDILIQFSYYAQRIGKIKVWWMIVY